jgi:pre-rRNA-processing protein TSR3
MITIIIRHRRENLRKCSLTGLEHRPDLKFYTYPIDPLPDLTGYLVLKVGAPPLSAADRGKGLLLIDGTWRLAERMERQLQQGLEARSLPGGYRTAYPRRQTGCPSEDEGLSSIEALYLAHKCLNLSTEGLLDHYHWKDHFLMINELSDV